MVICDATDSFQEMRLIRMCCAYALDDGCTAELISCMHMPLDEKKLMRLLAAHRLLLLVYQVLSSDFPKHAPPKLLNVLRKKAEPVIATQLRMIQASNQLSQAFSRALIPHAFLKGQTLNHMLWGRRMMRHSNDVDVLVRPCDVFKAHEVLQSLAFKPQCSVKSLRIHARLYRVSTKRDVAYMRAGLAKRIELHWKSYGTEFILEKGAAPELTDEAYLLYLCLHAAKHGWSRMIWVVDIIAFARIKKINMADIQRLAAKRRIKPVADEACLLASIWFGIDLLNKDDLERIKVREAYLNKRLLYGRKPLPETLWETYQKLYIMNAFCSGCWMQVRLWGQVFVGGTYSLCARRLKSRR